MSKTNESLLTWPAKIWLQREHEDEVYVKACGMTWCEDAIGEADVTYVREDLARGSRRMTDDYDVHEAGVEEGLSEAAKRIAALKAELEEAREIMKPFAEAESPQDNEPHDLTDLASEGGAACMILYGELRRARAFLAKMEAGNVNS